MFKVSHIRPAGAFVFAAAIAATTAAAAETITLRSSDGSINLTGEFISYSPESYIIDTVHGELRIDPELVNCIGVACPDTEAVKSDVIGAAEMPETTGAYDLALVTHPDNPVVSLTEQQISDIFTGEITNWSQVGGADMSINVVAAPVDQVAMRMRNDVAAISYVSADQRDTAKPLIVVDSCGMAMIPGGFATAADIPWMGGFAADYTDEGSFDIQTLNAVNYASSDAPISGIGTLEFRGHPLEKVRQHVDGPMAMHLLATQPSAYRTGVVQQMLDAMSGTDRISTTFRFREGSSRLDPRGAIDQERLIAFLQTQPAGTEVSLVGFTDSLGTFRDNLRLSRLRAWQAGERINAASAGSLDHVTITTLGFGEIAPAACNNDAEGRRINRRVEVWIKSPV